MNKEVTIYVVISQGSGRFWTFVVDNDNDAIKMIKKAAMDNWPYDKYGEESHKLNELTDLKKVIKYLHGDDGNIGEGNFSIMKSKGEVNSVKINFS